MKSTLLAAAGLWLALSAPFHSAWAGISTVYQFLGAPANGNEPQTDLVYDGGYFYGTTVSGGAHDFGSVYRVHPDGSGYQLIYSFENSGVLAAAGPQGAIALSGGTIYGIVNGGGPAAAGRLYKVNTDGNGFQFLHDFGGGLASDGADPVSGLILDGTTLYGTTTRGGNPFNRGAVFKIDTSGSGYGVLKAFDFANTGGDPQGRLLKLGSTLYGTTSVGVNTSASSGTVFKVNADGSGFSLLHQFAGGTSDGSTAIAGLVSDGTRLYGSTIHGGAVNGGTIFSMDLNGGNYQLLHSFDTVNGTGPQGELTLIGHTLYGTTSGGGPNGLGTAFQLDVSGSDFHSLGEFSGAEGLFPQTALWPLDNLLYGTTRFGGAGGILYSVAPLPPDLVGDANGDCSVGAADYALWAAQFGQTGPGLSADFDGNGSVGAGDYALWAANFGKTCAMGGASVPEPHTLTLALAAGGLLLASGVWRKRGQTPTQPSRHCDE